MSLAPQHIETLEKAGGLILEQLVAAGAITTDQQSAILSKQDQIKRETDEKPYVGELLARQDICEELGLDQRKISALKQPLLDLQASARSLLHSHSNREAAERCEGQDGAINLQAGVPDKEWTIADMNSGDPAKEQTALLQTRLLQTKVLTAAADLLQANGQPIPESTVSALYASQDAAREGFGSAIQAIRQEGQSPDALEAVYADLPKPGMPLQQKDIHEGISEAIGQLQQTGLLNAQQAGTLRMQELQRSQNISNLQTRRIVRDIGRGIDRVEAPQPDGHAAEQIARRSLPIEGRDGGHGR